MKMSVNTLSYINPLLPSPSLSLSVVTHLVVSGETLDEVCLAGRCRAAAIKSLVTMHPSQAAYVQRLAVDNCKHPTLALWLALEAEEDV